MPLPAAGQGESQARSPVAGKARLSSNTGVQVFSNSVGFVQKSVHFGPIQCPILFEERLGSVDVIGLVVQHAAKGLQDLFLRLDCQDGSARFDFGFSSHRVISLLCAVGAGPCLLGRERPAHRRPSAVPGAKDPGAGKSPFAVCSDIGLFG